MYIILKLELASNFLKAFKIIDAGVNKPSANQLDFKMYVRNWLFCIWLTSKYDYFSNVIANGNDSQ